MLIEYHGKNVENIDGELGAIVDCILIGYDADERTLKLRPIPDGYFEEEDFDAPIADCFFPKKQSSLKIV